MITKSQGPTTGYLHHWWKLWTAQNKNKGTKSPENLELQWVPKYHLNHSQTQIISRAQRQSYYIFVTSHFHWYPTKNQPCCSSISERDSMLFFCMGGQGWMGQTNHTWTHHKGKKVKVKVLPVHVMKAYRDSRDTAPFILNPIRR
jgi:hypothetical protein